MNTPLHSCQQTSPCIPLFTHANGRHLAELYVFFCDDLGQGRAGNIMLIIHPEVGANFFAARLTRAFFSQRFCTPYVELRSGLLRAVTTPPAEGLHPRSASHGRLFTPDLALWLLPWRSDVIDCVGGPDKEAVYDTCDFFP